MDNSWTPGSISRYRSRNKSPTSPIVSRGKAARNRSSRASESMLPEVRRGAGKIPRRESEQRRPTGGRRGVGAPIAESIVFGVGRLSERGGIESRRSAFGADAEVRRPPIQAGPAQERRAGAIGLASDW